MIYILAALVTGAVVRRPAGRAINRLANEFFAPLHCASRGPSSRPPTPAD